MTTPAVVVLVTGEPVPEAQARRGSYTDLIRQAAPDFGTQRWVAHDVRELDVVPDLTESLAVIITGSALSVTEPLPWKEQVAAHLRELVRSEVPVLGVCFGHQLLGHALGGRVGRSPSGREMGSVRLSLLEEDEVFGARGSMMVNATHVDSVVSLPPGARVVGYTEREPHAAVRFGPSAWGVQYHPELDAEVMRYYFGARRPALMSEGFDVDAGERGLVDAPEAAGVIERFLRVAHARRGSPGG